MVENRRETHCVLHKQEPETSEIALSLTRPPKRPLVVRTPTLTPSEAPWCSFGGYGLMLEKPILINGALLRTQRTLQTESDLV